MKCSFCHKKVEGVDMKSRYYACPHCHTTMETRLLKRPYIYSVGNHEKLENANVA